MTARRTKGTGSVFQRADGVWVGVLDLGMVGGKRVRRTVTAHRKTGTGGVIQRLDELRASVERGVLPDNLTVAQWLDYWTKHVVIRPTYKPTTVENYEMVCRRYLKPYLGKTYLQKLRPEHIRAMHDGLLEDGLSQASVVQAHAVLTSALTAAWKESRVTDNVAKKCPPVKAPANHYRSLTTPQRVQLLNSCAGLEYLRWTCALVLGMRQAEALGLRWRDVDDGIVTIAEQVRYLKGKPVRYAVKTDKSHRMISLPADLRDAFESARLLSGGEGYIFRDDPDDPTRPLHSATDRERWKEALVRAGLPAAHLHGARGTAITSIIEAGVPLEIAMKVTGHGDDGVVRAAYMKLAAEQSRLAIEAGTRGSV